MGNRLLDATGSDVGVHPSVRDCKGKQKTRTTGTGRTPLIPNGYLRFAPGPPENLASAATIIMEEWQISLSVERYIFAIQYWAVVRGTTSLRYFGHRVRPVR